MGFSQLLFSWTAIFPVIVLLYYFFRKKYKDQPISSTLYWEEVMQETKASPYLKHLQKNALFYLQMAALILFVIALMNPFIKTTELAGEQSIWIVDTSATMLAGKEGSLSTFEKHRKEMKELVSNLSGRPVTIITTGHEPKAIVRQETDIAVIQHAIDRLEVVYEEAQLPKAIDIAQAFIGDTATSIYLFTDSVERGELPIESEHVKWIVKGATKDLENVAITRFAATSSSDGSLALLRLKNETMKEKEVELSLVDNDGHVVVEEKIVLSADEELTKTFENLPVASHLLATIEVDDDYKVDNSIVSFIGGDQSPIVVDQQMHLLVQKGFQALENAVKIAPSDQLASIGNEAIIITNQTALLEQSPLPIVLIGRDDEITEVVNQLIDTADDSLFAFSKLEDVFVRSIYPSFEQFQTIASIEEKPFIQRSPKGDIVILADIQSTDWPLHPSFPLFLWSLQNELLEGTTTLGTFSPNESRAISVVPGDWSIYTMEDEYVASFTNGSEFKAPPKPGLYKVRSTSEEKQLIVQLPMEERIITEGGSFELGSLQSSSEEESSKYSIVVSLLLLILLLLLIEWEVQRRRGFAN